MKIKSIAAICKKNKQVVLFNRYSDSGTISQYIGDGNAVYPISGLPELDEESILTIFDVPEKQREDWLVRYRDIPEGISFEDTDATEKIVEQGNLSIVYSGKTLKPLQTRRGLVFIESRYLSPVSDVLDVLELYERVTPFGAPYIVAKAGFLLQAVIMPCDVISAQFVQRLQELTRQCAVSLDLREQERERQAAAESAGQFKVDPETGATIEPESEGSEMGKKKTGLITDEVRELINEVARATASMAYIDGMGGEVNYFRAMESLLFNYKKLAALVADYEAYTHVELQGRSASISSYSPSSGYTYRTEEDILDEMKRDKIISYHRTRARFEEIDRVVKLFAERKEFHVIRMYYFGEDAQGNERPAGAEPYTWEAIAAELEGMGLIRDAKSARRWRNKIVNDMAVCMFGKPAAVGVGTYRKERDKATD